MPNMREIEAAEAVLAASIQDVLRTLRVPGPRPDIHSASMERLQRDWPMLANALNQMDIAEAELRHKVGIGRG